MNNPLTFPAQQLDAPGNDIEAYINKISNIPILTPSEEQKLAKKCFFEADLDAAKKLIMAHLRFVVHIARGYRGYGLPQSDLIQEGNLGLMKAVKRFNPDVGVRMISFAVHWIKAEIHDYILKNWRIVRVATTKAQRRLFFNLRKSKKKLAWLTEQEISVLAEQLNVRKEDVRDMENRMLVNDSSFDTAERTSDDFEKMLPSQYLEDNRHNPAVEYETHMESEDNSARLKVALGALDTRSLDIIKSRWLREGERTTLQDLADKYDISAERVRQIENQAMKKIRGVLVA